MSAELLHGDPTISGGGGFLFESFSTQEFADIVMNLKNNPEVAKKAGEDGLRKVKLKYSPSVILNRYLDTFEQVIRNARSNN